MKNFKKVVALVLAFAMVLSMGTVAFAAEETSGDKLYELGLMQGKSATEKVLDLDEAADAATAMVLIGRALGWEVDEAATVAFTDVPDWAVPYVAYAAANGITLGETATTFGTTVDGKRMVTWVLRALGYDATQAWEDTDTLAATAGLAVPTADATRGVVADVIFDTLDATPVDGTATVIETLVAADATLEAKAVEYGLVEATPEAFAISSVAPWGLNGFVITFTSDIDGDVTIGDETTVAVVEDGNMAYVTLDGAELQNTTVDFTVTATGVDGVELSAVAASVVITDKEDPSVVSIVAEDAKTIKVTYSEPIVYTAVTKVFDDVLIDGAKFVGTSAVSTDGTVVTFTPNTKLAANSYVFTMEKVVDHAGFVAAAQAQTITVVADDAAPSVVSAEATDKNTLVVTFDENIDATAGSIKVGATTYALSGLQVSVSGAVATVTLTTPLVASDAFVAVTAYTTDITDAIGNVGADDVAFTFLAAFDETAPTATVTVTSDNYIAVEFSETVTGFTAASVTLVDSSDADKLASVATDESVSADYSSDDADIYLVVPTARNIDAATYTLTLAVSGNEPVDESVIANKMALVTMTVDLTDRLAPSIGDVFDLGSDVVRITFSEAMDTTTLANLSNYMWVDLSDTTKLLSNVTDATATVAADGKSVDLKIPGVASGIAVDDIILLNITDAAGTLIGDFNAVNDILAAPALTISAATLVETNKIKVTASSSLSIVDANDFKLYIDDDGDGRNPADDASLIYVTSTEIDSTTDTIAYLYLSGDLATDATISTFDVYVDVEGASIDTVDLYGTSATTGTVSVVGDEVAPTVTVAAGNTEATITFSEEVDATDLAELVSDLLVKDKNGAYVSLSRANLHVGTDRSADGDDNLINADVAAGFTVITITGLTNGDAYTVEVLSRNILDTTNNNATDGISATSVTPAA